MKKLFIFAAAAALTLASCGNKTQDNAANADSIAATENAEGSEATAQLSDEQQATVDNLTANLQKAVESKDAKSTISTLADLQTIYKNLVEQGKLEEAKAYASAIKKFISDNAEKLKSLSSGNTTVASLIDGIANLPTSAATTAEEAKAAVKSDVVNLASSAVAKGETAKAAAEDAAKAAVDNAKATAEKKVNEAVDNEKQKAADKINEASKKANDAVNNAAAKALKGLGK